VIRAVIAILFDTLQWTHVWALLVFLLRDAWIWKKDSWSVWIRAR